MRVTGLFELTATLPSGEVMRRTARNTLTHEGLVYLLDSALNYYVPTPDPTTLWRFGFVDTAGFTAYSQSDVLTSHAGWAEIALLGGRYIAARASAVIAVDCLSSYKIISKDYSPTSTVFTCRGLFLASTSDNSGLLWSTGDFAEGPFSLPVGSTLVITYTVTIDQ